MVGLSNFFVIGYPTINILSKEQKRLKQIKSKNDTALLALWSFCVARKVLKARPTLIESDVIITWKRKSFYSRFQSL